MPKALVSYYSRTGNTKRMAARIAEVLEAQGLEVDLKTVEDTAPADLLGYDCIVLGSPTYYGTMAWELKKLLDESVKFHGKLRGKVGGAFTSSANIGGGRTRGSPVRPLRPGLDRPARSEIARLLRIPRQEPGRADEEAL